MDNSDNESIDSQSPSPILNVAITEILEENKKDTPSIKQLSKEVVERLAYFFQIKEKFDESNDFVDAIEKAAEETRNVVGGSQTSAIFQALNAYKIVIREELGDRMNTETNDDSDDDGSEEEESEEDADQTDKDDDADMRSDDDDDDDDDSDISDWASSH